MLRPAASGPSVIVCNTCRHASDVRDVAPGGVRLAAAMRGSAADPRFAGIAIEEMPCLFACGESCTIYLRAPGKIGYVLGRFAPDADAASAILDFAVHYAASAEGEVPFQDWPDGVKWRFLVRVPPEGQVTE